MLKHICLNVVMFYSAVTLQNDIVYVGQPTHNIIVYHSMLNRDVSQVNQILIRIIDDIIGLISF